MTAADIQDRMDEACRTLLRLHVPGRWPAENTRSQWPWAVQAYWDNFAAMVGGKSPAVAAKEVARMLRGVALAPEAPTAGEKALMEEAFAWFPLLRVMKSSAAHCGRLPCCG